MKMPNGTRYFVHNTLATAVAISAMTNATEAVATVANAAGLAAGDFALISSGWPDIDGMVVKIKTVAVDKVTFASVDTSNVVNFLPGGGVGALQKVTAWTEVSEIMTAELSGGETQTSEVEYLAEKRKRLLKNGKSAKSQTLTMTYEPHKAWYARLIEADASDDLAVVKYQLPGGDVFLFSAYIGFDKEPSRTKGSVMANKAALLVNVDPIRYAAA